MKTRIAVALVLICGFVRISLRAQEPGKADDMQDCPMHKQHHPNNHHVAMLEHGDQVMGFSHATTTHHFRLLVAGGRWR